MTADPDSAKPPEVDAVLLWRRLEAFQFQDQGADFDFTARLARENGWTANFAERVILEYKRFLMLAVAAGHPVTPSVAVDQVWHLHLVFTRSYWRDLCERVLGQPLHHDPTRGGLEEAVKFRRQYAQTLASYRRLFEVEPPADIWPSADQRFTPNRLEWVDRSAHWVLPKPRLLRAGRFRRVPSIRAVGAPLFVSLFAVILAGCTTAWVNVFDWKGPEFLGLYAIGMLAAAVVAIAWDRILRGPAPRTITPPTDVYEIAFLGGGGGRVLDTALTALFGHGYLTLEAQKNKGVEVMACEASPKELSELHEVEKKLWKAAPRTGPVPLGDLRRACAEHLAAVQDRVAQAGLVLTTQALNQLRLARAIPFLLLLLLGLGKLVVGLGRGKPIGFLAVLLVVTLVCMVVLNVCTDRRTAAGRKAWAHLLQERWRRPKIVGGKLLSTPNEVALMVALSGSAALGVPGYWMLQEACRRQSKWGYGSGGGCSAGCGGGGSGCGSGGCGGGGCGGCS